MRKEEEFISMEKAFYIMRNKDIEGGPSQDQKGRQFIYLDNGRLSAAAKLYGNVADDRILEQLKTAEGFRKLVTKIGVSAEIPGEILHLEFVLQMYGKENKYSSGTELHFSVLSDGQEYTLDLENVNWSEKDDVAGQICFVFDCAGVQAKANVKLYIQGDYELSEPEEELPVDGSSSEYREMVENSLLYMGNTARLEAAFSKAKRGEEITVAFMGGSITQGAGAVPIHTKCYAARTFQKLQQFLGKDSPLKFVKAGVGGTPSELGLVRYERDVLQEGKVCPDIVVVEFAVNDADDETEGACFEGLVQRILFSPNKPAVVLLFSVFADDWNLQGRLSVIGYRYDLPMVSIKDAVVPQFYKSPTAGRVVSKSQYYYDPLHPANIGHEIMSDCLMNLFMQAAETGCKEKEEAFEPVFGWDFADVRRLDRRTNVDKAWIDAGSFFHTDRELQSVEMNDRRDPVPQFADNWMHVSGDTAFRMKIRCRLLMLVFKDSGDPMEGCAEVWVDGKMVRTADPHMNDWLHCNAVILLNEKEVSEHFVKINMCRLNENKKFTILGFGFSDTEVKNVGTSNNQKKSNLEF